MDEVDLGSRALKPMIDITQPFTAVHQSPVSSVSSQKDDIYKCKEEITRLKLEIDRLSMVYDETEAMGGRDHQISWLSRCLVFCRNPLQMRNIMHVEKPETLRQCHNMDSERSRILVDIQRLQGQCDQANDVLRAHCRLFPAGPPVPEEILMEIFSRCLPNEPPEHSWIPAASITLTMVCDRWRRVAISTPALWASLSINISDDRPKYMSMVQTWVVRSGDVPLSIYIYANNCSHEWPNTYAGIIRPLFRRLRCLSLCVKNCVFETFMEDPDLSVPLLEVLELIVFDTFPSHQLTILRTAKRLRSVFMRSLLQQPTPHLINMPWNQLTHFHSRFCLRVVDCVALLERCPNLELLEIRVVYHPSDPRLTISTLVTLPHLRSLHIVAEDGADFFSCFIMPALRSLTISSPSHHGGSSETWPKSAVLQLLERSGWSLERLHLRNKYTTEAELVDAVRSLPCLVNIVAMRDGENLVTSKVIDCLQERPCS